MDYFNKEKFCSQFDLCVFFLPQILKFPGGVCAKIVNEALGKMHCIQWSECVCVATFPILSHRITKRGKQNQFSDTKLIFYQCMSQNSMKRSSAKIVNGKHISEASLSFGEIWDIH